MALIPTHVFIFSARRGKQRPVTRNHGGAGSLGGRLCQKATRWLWGVGVFRGWPQVTGTKGSS